MFRFQITFKILKTKQINILKIVYFKKVKIYKTGISELKKFYTLLIRDSNLNKY